MSTRIVIVGAGGFGRGVHSWITTSPRFLAENQVEDVVFIDDNANPALLPGQLISTIADYTSELNDRVLCAIAAPKVRQHLVEQLQNKGAQFATFIDDRVITAGGSTVGEGSIVCPGVVLDADVTLEDHVHVNFNSSVGHDTVIGEFSTLSPATNIMGEVSVGQGSFFGGSAVILPRTTIGEHSVIGAGAVVLHGTDANVTVVGNPARQISR
ncbi:acetyltransferase [Actinomyces minihominis]|uniref:acetyltransferase n=1 Tax=Actinomyces minihominis TaxID=2002838 RepID=UPI000C080646|nr:acetyltransferase [Actinomyces minihominis]